MRLWALMGLVFLAGCGQSGVTPADNVIARINNYSLTVDDFKREMGLSLSVIKNYPDVPAAEFKAKLLDEMIVRQLLLEEAQKMNVDKDTAFMREVEGYWRQALLKMIVARKTDELIGKGKDLDRVVHDVYARESVQLELDIVTLADEQSAKELSAAVDGYDDLIARLGAKVVAHPAVSWWMAGDFSSAIEEIVWALKPGQVSAPIFSAEDGGWLVVKVVSRQDVNVRPFAEVEASLRKRIARDRTGAAMDRWIGELRSKARIEKHMDILEKIDLKTSVKAGGSNVR